MRHTPPEWAKRFVEWYCKPHLAEDLLGDMHEYFERNVKSLGVRRAKLIYIIDALKFFRSYTVRSPQVTITNWIMIGSYIKTSTRNLGRNKLFSSINIIGLAISMSVGLLMISFVHDLLSYDKFHENGDRIYRVLTWPNKESGWNQFASTSVRAGQLIKERVPGIEEQTTITQGFGGDAIIGDNIIPVEALWADNSFFKIFTFPMAHGDASTALENPYSIVLTETSAKKLFGDAEALGKAIRFDTVDYQVTGVLKDIPRFSHLRFEALVSFSTLEQQKKDDRGFSAWHNMWSNYVYLLLPENGDAAAIKAHLDEISKEENAVNPNEKRDLDLQALYHIALGKDLSNPIGPTMMVEVVWVIGALAFMVIMSACFNYTNLSIARSIRRFKEVGLRKVIGAGRGQVRQQFLYEAIIVSLLALILSFGMFLLLRDQFLGIAPELQNIVSLNLTPKLIAAFIVFSMLVGVIAGSLPALFFGNVSIITALKDASSVKVFKHVGLRKVLIVVQYTLTLIFITATFIGYSQYKTFLGFNLGFDTDNVLNIHFEGRSPVALVKEFSELPEVEGVSRSNIVTSVGSYWGGLVKRKGLPDSIKVWKNAVDENYFPIHHHEFVAGQNFIARPTTLEATTEVIVNENLVEKLGFAGNENAVGEEVIVDNRSLRIVGVLKDFHYGTVDSKIDPVMFTMWTDQDHGYINLKVRTADPVAMMTKIEQVWKKIDKVHPLDARFYKDSIERAYSEFSAMIKLIGFLAFLAISIASMGLFGMVVFATETRLKEVSIRKVMGASVSNLIFLLGRGFIVMLCVSAAIALPATYLFFEGVVLTNFPYHTPIGVIELFAGVIGVLLIAFVMIGSQTFKAARTNPAEVLKNE